MAKFIKIGLFGLKGLLSRPKIEWAREEPDHKGLCSMKTFLEK